MTNVDSSKLNDRTRTTASSSVNVMTRKATACSRSAINFASSRLAVRANGNATPSANMRSRSPCLSLKKDAAASIASRLRTSLLGKTIVLYPTSCFSARRKTGVRKRADDSVTGKGTLQYIQLMRVGGFARKHSSQQLIWSGGKPCGSDGV